MHITFLLFLQLYVLASIDAFKETEDKIWFHCDMTNSCSCGSNLNGVVYCDDDYLQIQPCYCMYYDETENMSIVGNCMPTCFKTRIGNTGNYHYSIQQYSVENATLFNQEMCTSESFRDLNREGRFCGRCKKGYGLSVYSYHYTSCIPCKNYGYKNWLKYFAVALIPLTLFYFIVITLNITVTSSHLNGIVFVLQCMGSPLQTRIIDGYLTAVSSDGNILHYGKEYRSLVGVPIVASLLGVVNLDFFRTLYPYFCIHPSLNILHVISLDFIIALYPFLLIFLTYFLVTMYDNNYRMFVWAWKPFKWCLRHYKRKFNVKSSLIEAFATFILLSNVKILGVCFDLLGSTRVYNVNGVKLNKLFLYYDANIDYFGSAHLPFAMLALFVGFVFVFFPFLMLVVYPCRSFQRLLNCLGCRCQVLHILMDAFQGSYKTQPHDLRVFSAFYLLLRFLVLFFLAYFGSIINFPVIGVILILGTVVFAAFQPYRNVSHNKIDTISMLFLALLYLGYTTDIMASYLDVHWLLAAQIIFIGSLAVITVYFIALLPFNKLRTFFSKIIKKKRVENLVEYNRNFDRTNSEYSPLLT